MDFKVTEFGNFEMESVDNSFNVSVKGCLYSDMSQYTKQLKNFLI